MQDAIDEAEEQFDEEWDKYTPGQNIDWTAVRIQCAMHAWSVVAAELCALGASECERPLPADEIRMISWRALVALVSRFDREHARRHPHWSVTALVDHHGDLPPWVQEKVRQHPLWIARKAKRKATPSGTPASSDASPPPVPAALSATKIPVPIAEEAAPPKEAGEILSLQAERQTGEAAEPGAAPASTPVGMADQAAERSFRRERNPRGGASPQRHIDELVGIAATMDPPPRGVLDLAREAAKREGKDFDAMHGAERRLFKRPCRHAFDVFTNRVRTR
jgi:hypothetical protein